MKKSLLLVAGSVLGAVMLVTVSTLSSATPAPAAPSASRTRDLCARPGLLFCEDFDRLPVGGAASLDWGTDTRHGTLVVEPLARRDRGLHVHTEGNGHAFLVADVSPPRTSFYGSLRLKVAQFPTSPDWAHYTLVEGSGQPAGLIRPIGGQYVPTVGKALWGVGSDLGPTGDWTAWQESAPSVANRWQCVEWRQHATDNRIDVWIDGVHQRDLTVSTRDHGGADVDFVLPEVDTVRFGWQLYQGDPTPAAYDVWMDDIALGTSRIGCA